MRVLVLTKRQYTSRDLLNDRFGRLRELPLALAALGHDVSGVCLSYRRRPEGLQVDEVGPGRVAWHALNLSRVVLPGAGGYWTLLDRFHRQAPQDVVLACSDAVHAVLGARVARRLGVPLVVDLYDNFESFGLTRLPGLRRAFRRAVVGADGVVCISRPLSGLVRDGYGYRGPLEVIENAVPHGLFHPRDHGECRLLLGLPESGLFVGTAGALSVTRGIEVLFRAFERLCAESPDVHLVLAGPRDPGLRLPRGDRVHDLGLLPPEQIPVVLSALDVAVICNRETEFGRYCFPQKFYEAVACGTPVISAATGSLRELLSQSPGYLYTPDDPASLTARLREQIGNKRPLELNAPTWSDLGERLEAFLEEVRSHRLKQRTRPLDGHDRAG